MALLRNGIFTSPALSKLQASTLDADDPVDLEIRHCKEQYKAATMLSKIQPLLDYCEYKDVADARAKLFAEDKKIVRVDSKLIEKRSQPPDETIFSTVCSFVGIATNQEKAKRCLQIILAVDELSKKVPHKEMIYVTNGIKNLSEIYHTLSKRGAYSPANFLSYLKITNEKPRVAAAIKELINAYKLDPEEHKNLVYEVARIHSLLFDRRIIPRLLNL